MAAFLIWVWRIFKLLVRSGAEQSATPEWPITLTTHNIPVFMLKQLTCTAPGTRAIRERSIIDDSEGAENEAGPNDSSSGPGYAGFPGSGDGPGRHAVSGPPVSERPETAPGKSPLEQYYSPGNPRPKFRAPNTATGRGYIATWEIDQGGQDNKVPEILPSFRAGGTF